VGDTARLSQPTVESRREWKAFGVRIYHLCQQVPLLLGIAPRRNHRFATLNNQQGAQINDQKKAEVFG
jgi:hypothetical protein